ncbi:hypothetical protein HYS97_01210 [Candidatus Daviesbacteria bacterium]|nr:hypothetical protein [Candidatus Daviesbacteria bacterium]
MVKVTKAIGGNTDFVTAQAFAYTKIGLISREKDRTGVLAATISASGEDIFTKVRTVGLALEDFFEGTEGGISERLKSSLEFLKKELSSGPLEINILLVLWQENVLHLLGHGRNMAYLERAGKLANLTESNTEEQVISGFVKPADKLLLINGRIVAEQEELKPAKIIGWDNEFIQKLFLVPEEDLEDEIENYLNQTGHVEPVAVIRIESELQVEDEQDKAADFAAVSSLETGSASTGQGLFGNLTHILFSSLVRLLKSKRIRFGIIAFLLLGTAFLGINFFLKNSREKNEGQFRELIISARQKYDEAQNLKDSDPQKAKLSFDEAKNKLGQALSLKPNDSEAAALKKQLEENSNLILKVSKITNWPIFISLDLIKKDFSTSRISYSLGKVLFLDEAKKTLISLDLAKKTNQILAGPQQLGQATKASLNGDIAFVYSLDKGVVKVDLLNEKVTQIIKPDSEWGKIEDVYAFSSNVYLLDSIKNQIWKYVPIETGYSNKTTYLRGDQKIDFAGSKKLLIDYSVWVFKTGPEILKFTGGASDYFDIGGVDKRVEEATSFFVPEGEDKFYLLDPKNSRLLILKKNGQYLSQLEGDKFKTASDFVVDEESKKLYLLEKNKIYAIELK